MDRDGIERLAKWVREARDERGLTQQQVASLAYMSLSTYQEVEAGHYTARGPNANTLNALDRALGLPTGTLARVRDGEDIEVPPPAVDNETIRRLHQTVEDLLRRVQSLENSQDD